MPTWIRLEGIRGVVAARGALREWGIPLKKSTMPGAIIFESKYKSIATRALERGIVAVDAGRYVVADDDILVKRMRLAESAATVRTVTKKRFASSSRAVLETKLADGLKSAGGTLQIASIKLSIKNKESDIARYKDSISIMTAEIARMRAQIPTALSAAKIRDEVEFISAVCDGARIDGNNLVVFYKRVICKPDSGAARLLGDIECVIKPGGKPDDIKFRKAGTTQINNVHPHVGSSGYVCWSGSYITVRDLLAANNYGQLVDFIHSWLETATTGDILTDFSIFSIVS